MSISGCLSPGYLLATRFFGRVTRSRRACLAASAAAVNASGRHAIRAQDLLFAYGLPTAGTGTATATLQRRLLLQK